MIFFLARICKKYNLFFNLFNYSSFRAILGLFFAFFCFLFFCEKFINFLKKLASFKVREFTPQSHQKKNNIPNLGGVLIILIALITSLFFTKFYNFEVCGFILAIISFGLIGCLDDLCKIYYKKGISVSQKILLQLFAAAAISIFLFKFGVDSCIYFPFFKNLKLNLGVFIIPWSMFVIIGTSNAVNLMDGLDGLVTGTLISNFSFFALICYLSGHIEFSEYLKIPFAASGELTVVCLILVGVSCGFLWFNAHPAQIFMGDVGSLSLGACLAYIALYSKQEFLLVISGGMLVFEVLSVLLQKFYVFKYKKKFFKMAPLHHHFELLGWHEPKITIRFNIISILLCLLALITLKIR